MRQAVAHGDRVVNASRGYTMGGRRLDILSSMWNQDFLEYGSEDDVCEDVPEGHVYTVRQTVKRASAEELVYLVSLTQDIPDEVVCPWEKVHKYMLTRNRQIIGYLREYGVARMRELSDKLGISLPACKWTLRQLRLLGLIDRKGNTHTWTTIDWRKCS